MLAVDGCLAEQNDQKDVPVAVVASFSPVESVSSRNRATVVRPLGPESEEHTPYYLVDSSRVELSIHPTKFVLGSKFGSSEDVASSIPLGAKWIRDLGNGKSMYESMAGVTRQSIAHFNEVYSRAFAVPVFQVVGMEATTVLINDVIIALEPGVVASDFFAKHPEFASFRPLDGTPDQWIGSLNGIYGEEALAYANDLAEEDGVVWTTPDFHVMRQPRFIPNDPLFIDTQQDPSSMGQWPFHNTGQYFGKVDADVDLPEAWDINPGGSPSIVIAVLDDGIPGDHPDLQTWINPLEVMDGIDNDGNGWVDDRLGWDFDDNDTNPSPVDITENHGTVLAGVAAAKGDNGIGVAGASYRSQIMRIRIDATGTLSGEASAFYYAAGRTKNGMGTWKSADIGLFAYGWGIPSIAISSALDWSTSQGRQGLGIAFAIAATSSGSNQSMDFPAAYSMTNGGVMAVGASNNLGLKTWNFAGSGQQLDFLAPGGAGGTLGSNSTDRPADDGVSPTDYLNTSTRSYAGTSISAALTAGISALVLSQAESLGVPLTASQLRAILRNSTELIGNVPYSPTNFHYGFGQVNAFAAVAGVGKAKLSLVSKDSVAEPNENLILEPSKRGGFSENRLRIRNQGTQPLVISSVSLPAGPFTLLDNIDGTVLGIGESREFVVRFAPNEVGSNFATLTIHSSDTDLAVQEFILEAAVSTPSIAGVVFEDRNGDGIVSFNDRRYAEEKVYIDRNQNLQLDEFVVVQNEPLIIPAWSVARSFITIENAEGTVQDLDLKFQLNYPWNFGAIHASLTAPDGRKIVVLSGLQGYQETKTFLLDDEATLPLSVDLLGSTNRYKPFVSLENLEGVSPNGTWTLEMTSTFSYQGDFGTLLSWSIDWSQEPRTITNQNGEYQFLDLPLGTHDVFWQGRPTRVATTPFAGVHSVTIAAQSEAYSERNFGFGVRNRFYGRYFTDANGNGRLDDDEATNTINSIFHDRNANGVEGPAIPTAVYPLAPSLPISDGSTTESKILINDYIERIEDLNLRVNISHPNVGDLSLTLVGPDGTRVLLANQVGGSGDNFANTVFDDEAFNSIANGQAPFAGSFRPSQGLSSYDGKTANGEWTLEIVDRVANGHVGVLNAWELRISSLLDGARSVSRNYTGNATLDLENGLTVVQQGVNAGRGFTIPPDGNHVVDVHGEPIFERFFGEVATTMPMVTGRMFEDWNGNGAFDDSDLSIFANDALFVDFNNNGFFDSGERTAVVQQDGSFSFASLPVGNHFVRLFTAKPGWSFTVPANGAFPITVSSPQDRITNVNFGLAKNGRVYGQVFEDADRDGQLDAVESGLEGRFLHDDIDIDGVVEPKRVYAFESMPFMKGPQGQTDSRESRIRVTGLTSPIQSIEVRIWLDGTESALSANGNIRIKLPNGTTRTLIQGGSYASLQDYRLTDAAWVSSSAAFFQGSATGSFRAREPLSNLSGQLGNGEWTLYVPSPDPSKNMLAKWSLHITTQDSGEDTAVSGPGGRFFMDLGAGDHSIVLRHMEGWENTQPADGRISVGSIGNPVFGVNFGLIRQTVLSNTRVPENAPVGTIVGEFTTEGFGTGVGLQYQLVSGLGDVHNDFFRIEGNQLLVDRPLDFERIRNLRILVRTSDSAQNRMDLPFEVTVDDSPEAPIRSAVISRPQISENTKTDQDLFFGRIVVVDPDDLDTHNFELVPGVGDMDNHRFQVLQSSLYLNQGELLDYETRPNFFIRVRTTDSGGLTVETPIELSIRDLPELDQLVMGDGTSQRSELKGLSLRFDRAVNIAPGAFELIKRGSAGGPVDIAYTTELDSLGRTVVAMQWSGSFVAVGSLTDGNYQLQIDSRKILDIQGLAIDGDRDGRPGGDYVFGAREADEFYRYFGDTNGDRIVGVSEFNEFRSSFGKSVGQTAYNELFDFDQNGIVGVLDFNEFRARFGKRLAHE